MAEIQCGELKNGGIVLQYFMQFRSDVLRNRIFEIWNTFFPLRWHFWK